MTDLSLFSPAGALHQGSALITRGYTPQLSNPALWYDETFGVSTSGSTLTGWSDRSGRGINASVGDAAFSYSSQTITSASGSSMQFSPVNAQTVFAVLEPLSFPSSSLSALISDTATPTNSDYVFWHGATSYEISLDGVANRTGRYRKNGAADLTGLNVGSSAITLNTAHIIAIRYATMPASWKTLNKFVALNAGVPTSYYGHFKWRQFLLFEREVSTSDIEILEGWAAHRYNLTSKLPSGHPYKNSAP